MPGSGVFGRLHQGCLASRRVSRGVRGGFSGDGGVTGLARFGRILAGSCLLMMTPPSALRILPGELPIDEVGGAPSHRLASSAKPRDRIQRATTPRIVVGGICDPDYAADFDARVAFHRIRSTEHFQTAVLDEKAER